MRSSSSLSLFAVTAALLLLLSVVLLAGVAQAAPAAKPAAAAAASAAQAAAAASAAASQSSGARSAPISTQAAGPYRTISLDEYDAFTKEGDWMIVFMSEKTDDANSVALDHTIRSVVDRIPNTVSVARVFCDGEEQLMACRRQGVGSIPTIKWKTDGMLVNYNLSHSGEDIAKFSQQMGNLSSLPTFPSTIFKSFNWLKDDVHVVMRAPNGVAPPGAASTKDKNTRLFTAISYTTPRTVFGFAPSLEELIANPNAEFTPECGLNGAAITPDTTVVGVLRAGPPAIFCTSYLLHVAGFRGWLVYGAVPLAYKLSMQNVSNLMTRREPAFGFIVPAGTAEDDAKYLAILDSMLKKGATQRLFYCPLDEIMSRWTESVMKYDPGAMAPAFVRYDIRHRDSGPAIKKVSSASAITAESFAAFVTEYLNYVPPPPPVTANAVDPSLGSATVTETTTAKSTASAPTPSAPAASVKAQSPPQQQQQAKKGPAAKSAGKK